MVSLPLVSIVIPVLNEIRALPIQLDLLRNLAPDWELVAADGGSSDGTLEAAASRGCRICRSPAGRARQMNEGARVSRGAWIWFLHADAAPSAGAVEALRRVAAENRLAGGCFRIRLDDPALVYRISDSLGNLAVDLSGIALGDHGIFCSRSAYEAVGGYPEIALMEDAAFYRKLGRAGRVKQLRPYLTVSARTYRRHGPWRTTLAYLVVLALYTMGAQPARLRRVLNCLLGVQPLDSEVGPAPPRK